MGLVVEKEKEIARNKATPIGHWYGQKTDNRDKRSTLHNTSSVSQNALGMEKEREQRALRTLPGMNGRKLVRDLHWGVMRSVVPGRRTSVPRLPGSTWLCPAIVTFVQTRRHKSGKQWIIRCRRCTGGGGLVLR